MNTATEYRDLPLSQLTESTTNPRRIFEDAPIRELADSIRAQGVLSPLLVRPLTEHSFEIVAGARRFRAAQMAEVSTVPVRIVRLSDAEALEAQLIENLATSRRSSNGGGSWLSRSVESGGAEIQHRADRGKDRQVSCLRCSAIESDRINRACGWGVLRRRDWCRTRSLIGQATTGPAGEGARGVLPRRLGGRRQEGDADYASSPAPQTVDRASTPANSQAGALRQARCPTCTRRRKLR